MTRLSRLLRGKMAKRTMDIETNDLKQSTCRSLSVLIGSWYVLFSSKRYCVQSNTISESRVQQVAKKYVTSTYLNVANSPPMFVTGSLLSLKSNISSRVWS